MNPGSPGVEVFEEELKTIGNYLHSPYESLKEKTAVGQVGSYPFQLTKLGFTRWLPLPCPFYSVEQNKCQVYPARAAVCRIYPVIFTGDDTYMSIRVTCDYGKDLIIGAYERLRTSDPNLEIKL
jgi:Fe-S-cluster containining protein